MKELREYRKRAQVARKRSARAEEALERRRNLLGQKSDELARIRRLGKAGSEEARQLRRQITGLEGRLEKERQSVRALKLDSIGSLGGVALQSQPWELVEGLDDRLPFLLLPVRIESRFMTVGDRKQLWVRIFPDDIAVHTHERNLTPGEINAGKIYWREVWRARQASNPEQRQQIEKGAWRALAEAYGGTRAAWIARQTRPASLDVPKVEDLQFPQFPAETLKAESWSQAPRSKVMPDRFVVMGFVNQKEVFRKAGNPIPDPLIVGPDPQAVEAEFRQQGGELLVGEDIAWIYDFAQAVKVGMGLQIELESPFDTRGFDRLLILGLRLSSDEGCAKHKEEYFGVR
jgi:hypothetical protein